MVASVKCKNVLSRVVNVCSKIVGERQMGMNDLYERRVRKKASEIANDDSHVFAQHYERLPSGRRLRTLKARTCRLKNSFIPMSIVLLNK